MKELNEKQAKTFVENMRISVFNKEITKVPIDWNVVDKIEIEDLVAIYTYRENDRILMTSASYPMPDELKKVVAENTKKECVLYSLENITLQKEKKVLKMENLLELDSIKNDFVFDMRLPLFVLTNQNGVFGASAMLFEDILDKIRNLFGRDYYIIPSTIHEVFIIPKDEEEHFKWNMDLLGLITSAFTEESERLDFKVYLYSEFVKKVRNIFD